MDNNEQFTLAFGIIVLLSFIVNVFLHVGIFNVIIAITQFGFSVAGFIFSIRVIKEKKLGFGISFLVFLSYLISSRAA